jgi:primosomal protein N' (replication factor Y)
LANVVVSSPSPDQAAAEAERSAAWLRARCQESPKPVKLVGPAPAPIERLHGRFRWHFLLKSGSPAALGALLDAYLDTHRPKGGDVRIVVDLDPVALL